jgi:hypothetical protein
MSATTVWTAYARNLEDVLLRRALGHIAHGVYLDAAAGEPLRASATQALYERGWHGVNLAPSTARLRRLRIARPADVNLALAAAAAPGVDDWYELGDGVGDGDGTRDAALAARTASLGAGATGVVRHRVALQTLEALWAEHIDGPLHLLRVDGEAPLAGLDLMRRRPWIVLLRAPGKTAPAALAAAGYTLAYADGYNQFHVAAEHAGLAAALALPPHPDDNFVLCDDHPYCQPVAPWRARAAAAEAAAEEARGWARDHVREWREKNDRLETAVRDGAEAAARAMTAERDAANATLRAVLAEQSAAEANARAHAAEGQLPALHERILQAHATLTAVSTSLSWRVTAPLRGANLLWSRVRAGLRALPRRLARAALRRARSLAGAALRYVDARPRLSFFLRRNLSRLPLVAPLLRRIKLRLQMAPVHGAANPAAAAPWSAGAPADLDALPDGARRVFDDLRRARDQRPHL